MCARVAGVCKGGGGEPSLFDRLKPGENKNRRGRLRALGGGWLGLFTALEKNGHCVIRATDLR